MQQLEHRFYSRQEIAAVTLCNPNDTKHFARDVKAKLTKWGYEFEYKPSGITITKCPETATERLTEILIRELDVNVQIDPYAFSCFISAFFKHEAFESMPWEERANFLRQKYDVEVTDRTLRNWCSRLMSDNILFKIGEKTSWKTTVLNGSKTRTKLTNDDPQMHKYFARRRKLVAKKERKYRQQGLTPKDAKRQAWRNVMLQLWDEYHCCYYTCKGFILNGIDTTQGEILYQIYELTQEIAGIPVTAPQCRSEREECFYAEWFNT